MEVGVQRHAVVSVHRSLLRFVKDRLHRDSIRREQQTHPVALAGFACVWPKPVFQCFRQCIAFDGVLLAMHPVDGNFGELGREDLTLCLDAN